MSKNQKSTSQKLTRVEKKEIAAAIERAKHKDKKEKSAQDSIPYRFSMYRRPKVSPFRPLRTA